MSGVLTFNGDVADDSESTGWLAELQRRSQCGTSSLYCGRLATWSHGQ